MDRPGPAAGRWLEAARERRPRRMAAGRGLSGPLPTESGLHGSFSGAAAPYSSYGFRSRSRDDAFPGAAFLLSAPFCPELFSDQTSIHIKGEISLRSPQGVGKCGIKWRCLLGGGIPVYRL